MNWQVEWLDEAKKDMRKLGKAEQIQVLKGIEKVRTNPLPTSQGGYGKPLLRNGIMTIIVVGIRSDSDAYIKANKRRKEYGR